MKHKTAPDISGSAVKHPVPGSLTAPAGKPSKKKRLRKRRGVFYGTFFDILIVILCLSGALAAFYLFWRDINKTLTKLNETPIAIVQFKKNTVQRQFGNRVIWDVLQKDSPVYNNDTILTQALSEATIVFIDAQGVEGNRFNLSENSFIQISAGKIDLINGKIDIQTVAHGTRLELKSAKTVVEIGLNSTVSANSAETMGGSIQVLEGSAKVETANGVSEAVAGEALQVSAKGERETVAQIVLLSPKPNQSILMTEIAAENSSQHNVHFHWRASDFNDNDFVRFEIASDQRFAKIVQSADIRNSTEQVVALGAGTYWWRAYPASRAEEQQNGMTFMSNKFSLVAAAAPKLVQPADGAVIAYHAETPPAIRLQWTSGAGASFSDGNAPNYLVEVSSLVSMQDPKIQQEVLDQNFFMARELTAGRWYWRVRAVYPESFEGAHIARQPSQTASFLLERSASGITAPQPVNPADGAELMLERGVRLSWQAVNEAAAYTVQIAQNSSFSPPLIDQKVSANYFNVPQNTVQSFREGVYYWRVQTQDSSGGASPFSAIRSWNLSTEPIPVELVYPRDNWTGGESAFTSTHFTWKLNTSGTNGITRWQVSTNADFTDLKADIRGNGVDIEPSPIEAGSYYWRVFWNEANNTEKTFATPPRRFTVQPSGRILLEYPADNAELDGVAVMRSPPSLRWSSSEAVLRSRLLLSTHPNPAADSAPVLDILNPAWNIPLPVLRPGVYYWIVQGETRSGVNISAPHPQSFRVGAISHIQPVTLQSPSQNFILNAAALKTSRSINFSWTAQPAANGYLLTIYRAADRTRAAPVFKSQLLKQTSFAFSDLTVLDNGAFVWSVEPVYASLAGEIEQHGETREATFTVNIALPQTPSLQNEESFGF